MNSKQLAISSGIESEIVCELIGLISPKTWIVAFLFKFDGRFEESSGDTNIFIYPGYKFRAINGLITNFHLPKSTLIMLVSALANKEFILKSYEEAVKEKYRFFSFGDAMFIE